MNAPLAGIRVVDFTRVLSGPIVGRLLSDLGAEVIKVEPPEGDLTRYAYPRIGSTSLYFAQQNCGKRNVSLDLSYEEATEIAKALCENADVVLENFRPGVMAKYGIDYPSVQTTNPGVVYASISGYGQTGPWSDRRAYAVVVHAEAGLIDSGVRMRSDAAGTVSPPTQDGMSHADVYAGLSACNGVLAALFARERNGGTGDYIDVAMAEALLFVQDFAHWDYAPPESHNPDRWPTLAPAYSPIVTTADNEQVVIAGDPAGVGVFELYGHAMTNSDLIADERFTNLVTRRANRAALIEIVQSWASQLTTNDLISRLSEVGLANGVVRSVSDILDTQWAHERAVLVSQPNGSADPIPVVQSPFRFTHARVGVRGEAAYRGQHNFDVLHNELGFDVDRIQAWLESGVLSQRPPRA